MSKGRGIFRQPRQDYCIKDSSVSQKHFHYHESKVKGNDQEKSKFTKYFPRISSAETPSNIQLWLEQNGLLEVGFNKKRIVALKEVSPKLNLGDRNIRIFRKIDIHKDKTSKKRSKKCLLHKNKNLGMKKTSWVDLEGFLQENMGEECDEEGETYELCREGDNLIEDNQKYKNDIGVKIASVDRGGGDLKIQSTTITSENPKNKSLSTIEILSARTDLTNDSFHSICTQTSVAQSQSERKYNLKKGVTTLNVEVPEENPETNKNSKVVIRIFTTKSGQVRGNHSVTNENRTNMNIQPFSTIEILNEPESASESFNQNPALKVHKDNETIKIVAVKSSGINTEPLTRCYEDKEVQVELTQSSSTCDFSNTQLREDKTITNIPNQEQLERIINLEADTKSNFDIKQIIIPPIVDSSTKTDSVQSINPLGKEYVDDKQIQTENFTKRKVSLFRIKSKVFSKKVRKNRKVKQMLDSMELVHFKNRILIKDEPRRSESYFPSENNYQSNSFNKSWLTLAPNENNISDNRGSQEIQSRKGNVNLKFQNLISNNFQTYFAKAIFENPYSKVKNSDSETRKNMICSNRNKTGDGPDQIATVKKDKGNKLEPIYKQNKNSMFHGKYPDDYGKKVLNFNKRKLLQKIDEGEVVNNSIDTIYYVVDKITQTPCHKDGETFSKHFVKTIQIQSRKRSKKLHKLGHKSTQMYEYLTAGQLYCRDWIRRNLFYIEYLNPFTTFLSRKIENDSTKSAISE